MKSPHILLGTLLISLSAQVFGSSETADSIYLNGTILTINDAAPTAEAVAVKDGRILAVGKASEVTKTRGEQTTTIDLNGRTLLPGFVDSHGHAYLVGLQASTANLLPPPDGDGSNIPALQALMSDWAAPPTEDTTP